MDPLLIRINHRCFSSNAKVSTVDNLIRKTIQVSFFKETLTANNECVKIDAVIFVIVVYTENVQI